ncbi:sensor domain-containing protein [[Mycobacterium] nativiensis]|uniref:Sensor domain-containing protein n=1 Tax=[Mycobacterium] nativiensis TaxID=2855503 RepID=A0ABU5Y2Q1_9MYCO|nr:sensor domain-containing protein [Mycolicibacter sp. MYC340]MEB3034357.1 sensor domain-containing protein [Mycolicibacter sp. MYC340]
MSGIGIATLGGLPAPAVADGDWVQPGQVAMLIPSDDEVGTYAGMPMSNVGSVSMVPSPPEALRERDDCRLFYEVGTTELVGSNYASHRGQRWENRSQDAAALVAVTTFPSVAEAVAAFTNAYNRPAIDRCLHARLVGADVDPGVTMDLVHVESSPDTTVISWLLSARHNGANMGFTSAFLVAVGANFMVEVMTSQWGNAAVTMDRLSQHVMDRVH